MYVKDSRIIAIVLLDNWRKIMKDISLIICIIITGIMILLHIALFLGAPLGEYVMGGAEKVVPRKLRKFNIIYSLLFLWFVIVFISNLSNSSLILYNTLIFISLIIYSLFLVYAIIANFCITKNKKERLLMGPLSIICFVCSIIVLLPF